MFCDDTIVRGTQLGDTIGRLYRVGAKEIHLRIACPPLLFGCRFLSFSRSRYEMDLAARRAVCELKERPDEVPPAYLSEISAEYAAVEGLHVLLDRPRPGTGILPAADGTGALRFTSAITVNRMLEWRM